MEYKFYKKPVTTPYLILSRSALPTKIKWASLVQEGVRRLVNTRRQLDWDTIKTDILSEFSWAMKISGYSEKFRLDVIKAAIVTYERRCARADAGIAPLHRPRGWRSEERRQAKAIALNSWYRPHNTVCFVPATPNSELANKLQEFVDIEMKKINMSAKIVETAGVSIRDQTVRLDLTGCKFPDCWACESGEKGASHTKRGPVYSGECLDCGEVNITAGYDGESGFSAYNRFKSHKASINSNTTSNAFARHLNEFHPDKIKDHTGFKVKVEGTFKKCLDRQVKEGINIFANSEKRDIQMNSKLDFHGPSATRTTTSREVPTRQPRRTGGKR